MAAASGLLTLVTVGQTIRPLRRLGLLAPRDPATGPQGYPVNRGASNAGVVDLARSPDYRLAVGGRVATPLSLDHAQLLALPAHAASLPIACVEGWSYSAAWSGVRVRDLLAMAGAAPDRTVLIESLEPNGAYRTSTLNPGQAADRDTLLATHLDGEPLAIDHGFPCRLIAPNRPGVLQTKWVSQGDGAVTEIEAGTPEGGTGAETSVQSADHRAGPLFWASAAAGWVVIGFGLWGIFSNRLDTRPANLAKFVVGGALLHDLLFAPLVLLAAVGLARVVPGRARSTVLAALFVTGALAALLVPAGQGLRAGRQQPHFAAPQLRPEPRHRPRGGLGGGGRGARRAPAPPAPLVSPLTHTVAAPAPNTRDMRALRYTGVAAIVTVWTTLLTATVISGFDLLGDDPLSYLGTQSSSAALFTAGLLLPAVLLTAFHHHVRGRYPVSAGFSVAMLVGLAGQVVAAFVPIGGDPTDHRIHTASALVLGISLPLLMWRFAAGQPSGSWRRLTYGLFWAEAAACAAGLYLSARSIAPLAEILPGTVFHVWIVVVTFAGCAGAGAGRRLSAVPGQITVTAAGGASRA